MIWMPMACKEGKRTGKGLIFWIVVCILPLVCVCTSDCSLYLCYTKICMPPWIRRVDASIWWPCKRRDTTWHRRLATRLPVGGLALLKSLCAQFAIGFFFLAVGIIYRGSLHTLCKKYYIFFPPIYVHCCMNVLLMLFERTLSDTRIIEAVWLMRLHKNYKKRPYSLFTLFHTLMVYRINMEMSAFHCSPKWGRDPAGSVGGKHTTTLNYSLPNLSVSINCLMRYRIFGQPTGEWVGVWAMIRLSCSSLSLY